jgi:hypothetical protein
VQAVDAAKVKVYVDKLMSSKPCGMLLGDQASMPKFESIAARFK